VTGYEVSDEELKEQRIRAEWDGKDALWNFKPRCKLCKREWHGLPQGSCPGEYGGDK
jgi:hypothetical protein